MARIVLGIGTSHSPLLVLGGPQWEFRSNDDRRNKSLNTLDGRLVSYDDLVKERGEPYLKESDPAGFPAMASKADLLLRHRSPVVDKDSLKVFRSLHVVNDERGIAVRLRALV